MKLNVKASPFRERLIARISEITGAKFVGDHEYLMVTFFNGIVG